MRRFKFLEYNDDPAVIVSPRADADAAENCAEKPFDDGEKSDCWRVAEFALGSLLSSKSNKWQSRAETRTVVPYF